MKKWIVLCALLLALAVAPAALAAGNVTIAVQGENGFDDYISSMFAWDGRLLMVSWNKMYVWKPGEEGLTTVEGYDELSSSIYAGQTVNEDGSSSLVLGDEEIELEEGEGISLSSQIIVAGDKLYRMMYLYGDSGAARSMLVEISIADDGTLSIGGVVDLDDAMIVEYGDGYVGERDITNTCYYDGMLYGLSYGENGRELLAIDLENAEVEPMELDTDNEIVGLSPFTEGKLLIIEVDYSSEEGAASLLVYDVESEELTSLGELPRANWNVPAAIAYDEERGMIYYVLSGSVWRMTVSEDGMGEPEEFGDMPLDIYTDSSAVLLGDLYILSSYDGVVGRDVTIDKLPEQKLRVANMAYIDAVKRAYFSFTDKHPEYMVSIGDSGSSSSLLQDMMNRSSDVDIYTLQVSDSAFSALMNRGFMAELSGSEKLSTAVEAMYESLQNVVKKDGELYAVPMNMYTSAYGINRKLLTEKLGYAQEDIPDNWLDLFGLIADLAQKNVFEEYPEISLLGPGYTENDVKYNFFMSMMQTYYLWLDQNEENLTAGSDMLLSLCDAFEAIDWSAFGLPTEYENSEGSWEYNEENILFSSTSVQPQNYYSEEIEEAMLAIAPGETPMLRTEVYVAFVNPFSEHREEAIEYLEKALDLMEDVMRITMMPEENEPILSSWYEENIKYYDETIASYEEQLADENLDEETRDMLTQSLADMQTWRAEYEEEGRWLVSETAIKRYRESAQYLTPARSAIWDDDTYSQVSQYMDGAITAKQLCTELEKTLQMKRLEGQ